MKPKLVFVALLMFFAFSCQKESMDTDMTTTFEESSQKMQSVNNLPILKYPKLQMVPLKGTVIEVGDFSVPPLLCGPIPFPRRFLDIGGTVTHLGNVAGGYVQFSSCNPDIINGQEVYLADLVGVLQASNGDEVQYEGVLWFDRINPAVGGTDCTITGGTGRWEDAHGHFEFYNFERKEDGTLHASLKGKITPPGVANQ